MPFSANNFAKIQNKKKTTEKPGSTDTHIAKRPDIEGNGLSLNNLSAAIQARKKENIETPTFVRVKSEAAEAVNPKELLPLQRAAEESAAAKSPEYLSKRMGDMGLDYTDPFLYEWQDQIDKSELVGYIEPGAHPTVDQSSPYLSKRISDEGLDTSADPRNAVSRVLGAAASGAPAWIAAKAENVRLGNEWTVEHSPDGASISDYALEQYRAGKLEGAAKEAVENYLAKQQQLKDSVEGLKEFSDRWNEYAAQGLADASYGIDTNTASGKLAGWSLQGLQSVSQNLMDVAAGKLIGIGGAAAPLEGEGKLIQYANKARSLFNYVPFAERSFGAAAGEARHADADLSTQLDYALKNTIKEVATEMMWSTGDVFGVGAFDDLAEKGVKDLVRKSAASGPMKEVLATAASLGMAFTTEAIEEAVGTLVEEFYLKQILNPNAEPPTGMDLINVLLESAMVGGLSGMMMGGMNMASQNVNASINQIRARATEILEAAENSGSEEAKELAKKARENADKGYLTSDLQDLEQMTAEAEFEEIVKEQRKEVEERSRNPYRDMGTEDAEELIRRGNAYGNARASQMNAETASAAAMQDVAMNVAKAEAETGRSETVRQAVKEANAGEVSDATAERILNDTRASEYFTVDVTDNMTEAEKLNAVKAAVEVAAEAENRAAAARNEAQKTTTQSEENAPSTGRFLDGIKDTLGTAGQGEFSRIMGMPAETMSRQEIADRAMAATVIYNAGANGTAVENIRLKNNPLTADEMSAMYSAGVKDERQSSNRTGERQNDLAAGERSEEISQRARETRARRKGAAVQRAAVRAAVEDGRAVSAQEIGFRNGSDTKNLKVLPESARSALRKTERTAVENLEKRGFKVVLFTAADENNIGGVLETADGRYVRGAIQDGNTIFLSADHWNYTIEQIARHEYFHSVLDSNPELRENIVRKLYDTFSAAEILKMQQAYAEDYNWSGVDAEYVMDEILCDAFGGMDIFEDRALFAYHATDYSEIVREMAKGAKVGEGLSEGETRYSLEAFEDGTRFVNVQTDQKQFDGLQPEEKTKLAAKIINSRFKGRVIGIDNRAYVDRRSANEYSHPSKRLDENLYDAKLHAATELDNLVDAGMNYRHEDDGKDGHYHKGNTGGFDYYDTIFKVAGDYYKGIVNIEIVAKGRRLKDITGIENITEDITVRFGENPKTVFLRDTSMDTITQSPKEGNNKSPKQNFSEEKDFTAELINRSMTMQQAKRLVEMAFNANGIREWYDNKYRTADEWLAAEGADEVADYIENTYTTQQRFYDLISGTEIETSIDDGDIVVADILQAYADGTLTGRNGRESRMPVNTAAKRGISDSRFYAPFAGTDAAYENYDLANQRVSKNNKEEIYSARRDLLFFAHREGAAEALGITNKELNQKLRSWSAYPSTARELSQRINDGVAPENHWTGLQNSSILSQSAVSREDIASQVKEVAGDPDGYQLNYVGKTMLALDTHINWSELSFDFKRSRLVSNRALGFYDDSKRNIVIGSSGYLNTVAHEMGHALDHRWTRDILAVREGSGLPLSELSVRSKADYKSEAAYNFHKNFNAFVKSLYEVNDTKSSYTQKGTETLARFVARFVEWTNETAGVSFFSETDHYKDRFTTSQFIEFAKLLQEKSAVDNELAALTGRTRFSEESEAEYSRLSKEADEIVRQMKAIEGSDEYKDRMAAAIAAEGEKQKAMLKDFDQWLEDNGYNELARRRNQIADAKSKAYRTTQEDNERARKTAIEEYRKLFTPEYAEKYAKKAERKYGTTGNYDKAAYLDVNGKLIDFSDGQRYRVNDHREIAEILDFLPDTREYSDGLIEFMNLGNIRMQTYGIDIAKAPNAKQIAALKQFVRHLDGEITVDISDERGYTIDSIDYGEGTRPDRVVNDILRYFNEGVKPSEGSSMYARFSEESRIRSGMTEKARYDALRGRTITVKAHDPSTARTISAEVSQKLKTLKMGEPRKVLKNIASEYGVLKEYKHKDTGLSFNFSGHNLEESVYQQSKIELDDKYNLFGRMLLCLDDVVNSAREIEVHAPGKDVEDGDLKAVHILASAYKEGETVYPVKLVVKEYNGNKANRLYVSIVVGKIKESALTGSSHNENISQTFSTYKIADLLREVKNNPQGDSLGKYIPVQFANAASTEGTVNLSEEPISSFAMRSAQAQDDIEKLQQDLLLSREEASYWRGLRTESSRVVNATDVKRVSKEVLAKWESDLKPGEITERMTELADCLYKGMGMDEVIPLALEIADEICNSAKVVTDSAAYAEYIRLKQFVRSHAIKRSSEVDDPYFYKRNFGKLKITKDGTPMDIMWGELQSEFGKELFPDEVSTIADKMLHLADVLESIEPVYENPYNANYAEAVEECAYGLMTDIMRGGVRYEPVMITSENSTAASEYNKTIAEKNRQIERLQKENEKTVEYYKEREARAKELLKQVRERRDERIAELKQHYKEVAMGKKWRRAESDARKKLQRIAKRLQNRKLPAVSRALLEQYIGDLDTAALSITGAKLEELKDLQVWYSNKKATDPDFIANPEIEKKLARINKKRISELSIDEVVELTQILLNIENTINTERKMIDTEDRRDVYAMGLETIDNIRSSRGTKADIKDWVISNTLSPVRAVRRFTGYAASDPMYRAVTALADGQRKMFDYQMRASRMFDTWAKDKKYTKSLQDVIKIQGFRGGELVDAEITRDMAIALYMHAKNDQNLAHIRDGGVTIPDLKALRKDPGNAYGQGAIRIKLSPAMVKQIESKLTAKDKAYAAAAAKYFDTMAQNEINEVSEKLVGYSLAQVENYFPINTDSSFTRKEFESLQMDGTIEGMGFLKERTDAKNPIYLRGFTDVLNKSIDMNAKYVGLAIPVRNFNKLWNVTTADYSDADNIEHFTGSVKEAMTQKWGKRGVNYIEKMMTDLQNANVKSDELDHLLGKVRSNYAGAVLTLNLSVAIKQAASYPTAGAVLGGKALAKALANPKVDANLIAKYTPLYWYRSQGFADQELGDLKSRGRQIPKLLNWIQAADMATTRTLWKASEYYVKDNNKGLTPGTDAFYQEVARIYNRVIEETQPNYTTMQRPQLLRSDSSMVQSIAMFKTQPFQNFNVLYDAVGEYEALARAKKAGANVDLKAAGKNVARAVSSQVVQLAVFSAMTFIWNMIRRKHDKYEDEEGEMTAASTFKGIGKDMISGSFSMIPFGSNLYELMDSVVNGAQYYGFDSVTITALDDTATSIINQWNLIKDATGTIAEGGTSDWNTFRIKTKKNLNKISKLAGIPLENVNNLYEAAYHWAALYAEGEYMGEYRFLTLTVSPESSKVKYYALLKKAWLNDKKAFEELQQEMLDSGYFTEKGINGKISKWKKELDE